MLPIEVVNNPVGTRYPRCFTVAVVVRKSFSTCPALAARARRQGQKIRVDITGLKECSEESMVKCKRKTSNSWTENDMQKAIKGFREEEANVMLLSC
ncbi:hypothetical protein ANN_06852 [Periplaneta americana]|uniref:Uncharacterized protein n=1 Tax=Periplaneta americana TaxID=6978 RepID=A0ABQ8TGI6_PERAM|nr:hypothetical protein ANN_06852 [Periplaneta americana]